jgi:peptidoglycan/LPS O-acetylase OafA/YrhL
LKTGIGEWLARKLSRVTSTGEYIPEIDGLRFLAILPVMVIHATSCYVSNLPSGAAVPGQGPGIEGVLYPLFIRGWLGVPIFFVLSGFILGLPCCAASPASNRPTSSASPRIGSC